MSQKTLKKMRDRYRNKAANPRPYTPVICNNHEIKKTNVRRITNYLIGQISGMGMNVAVIKSCISRSQYLRIDAWNRRYTIRISDHALRHGKKYDFCIYTNIPYEKALHYLTFIGIFRKITGEMPKNKRINLENFRENGEGRQI